MTRTDGKRFLAGMLAILCCLACLLASCKDKDGREGTTCAFYDIPVIPEGWKIAMPPMINNENGRSLANYYNNEENASVTINIAASEGKTLEELAAEVVENLTAQGGKVVDAPVQDGLLMRITGTFTGQEQGHIWVGTTNDYMALTVATGNLDACRVFFASLRNADPTLLPVEN